MRKCLIRLGSWLILKGLSLRYKIEVSGLHQLKLNKGGILFLPNHPALIDPVIVNALLAPKFHPRPLVIENFYYSKGIRFFMNLVRALPMPNLEVSTNTWKLRQVEKSLHKVREQVQKGENFLIYPSGQLKQKGHEVIGGNSFIQRILKVSPDVQVVLVRTSGLWGSLFSKAIKGESPDFWEVFKYGIKILLKNGIFFCPKRKVTVEFELLDLEFPYSGTRLELNQHLEKRYNRYLDRSGNRVNDEPLSLVSFSFFSKELPIINKKEKSNTLNKKLDVPEHIRKDVFCELTKLSGISSISDTMNLSRDLGLDSLDIATLGAFLGERYDVESITPGKLRFVHDLLELIVEGSLTKPKLDTGNLRYYEWPKESFRPKVQFPKGKLIPECFLNTCDRMGQAMACGDDFSKIMSYREVKMGVMVLAQKWLKIPDTYIAVLLPSSVGCYILILSILFAGKIPVILNWTAGVRSLNFAQETLKFSTVLSSRRFLERVESIELGKLEDQITLMEDFRQTISLLDKLKGVFLSHRKGKDLYKRFKLDQLKEDDPAVILFTSGTESYPKVVPLSHKNILSNEKSALQAVHLDKKDILYGVLPPFHSFGFSVTGIFPILSGLRVFYAPDPTDTHGMARDCFFRKITMLCCAPSFYLNLFRVATPRQLKSVRLVVSGAEKAPPELFKQVKRLGKELIEGYGITECSPIVTINSAGEKAHGVGMPIEGVELCVIHPETQDKIPQDKQGEICIRGPGVFSGYLGENVPNPFIELDGEKWYRSGDLGYIASDGALILEGRLKRFVKIGGEMVSLTALEEELFSYGKDQGLIQEEDKPQLALAVKEGVKPHLILFTTFPIQKERVNEALRRVGFARIVKVSEVRQIEEIPMTGTGKVQLRKLNEMIHVENL